MKLVKFNEQKNYNDLVYLAGHVYAFERDDLVTRWVKRGCTVLDKYDGDITENPLEEEAKTHKNKPKSTKKSSKKNNKKTEVLKVEEKTPETPKVEEEEPKVEDKPSEDIDTALDIMNEEAEKYLDEQEKSEEEVEVSL
jgi:hypothetical protein